MVNWQRGSSLTSAETEATTPKPERAPRMSPLGNLMCSAACCLAVACREAVGEQRASTGCALSCSMYTPCGTTSGCDGGEKPGEIEEKGAGKRGKLPCAHPIIGLKLVNLLTEHLHPEFLAQEFYNLERVREAGPVLGVALNEAHTHLEPNGLNLSRGMLQLRSRRLLPLEIPESQLHQLHVQKGKRGLGHLRGGALPGRHSCRKKLLWEL